jgi:hypothetical protein
MRILVVEEDSGIADFVAKGLREQAYAADVAANGKDELYQPTVSAYDLAIKEEVTLERQILTVHCSGYRCLDLFASAIRTPWRCGIRHGEKRYSQGDRDTICLGQSPLRSSIRRSG